MDMSYDTWDEIKNGIESCFDDGDGSLELDHIRLTQNTQTNNILVEVSGEFSDIYNNDFTV